MSEREPPESATRATESQREPTEDELRAAMEEQLRRIKVQDVLLQTVATLVNLAGRRLGLAPGTEGERDLEQARLAIEATRALVPLLSSEEAGAIREALTQLQMAFAREAQGTGTAGGGARSDEEAEGAREGAKPVPDPAARRRGSAEEAERAKGRSKIWTPPGS